MDDVSLCAVFGSSGDFEQAIWYVHFFFVTTVLYLYPVIFSLR